jgi:hypothetical protein
MLVAKQFLPELQRYGQALQASIIVQITPPPPSPPAMLGRTPIRINTLAFALIVSQLLRFVKMVKREASSI